MNNCLDIPMVENCDEGCFVKFKIDEKLALIEIQIKSNEFKSDMYRSLKCMECLISIESKIENQIEELKEKLKEYYGMFLKFQENGARKEKEM